MFCYSKVKWYKESNPTMSSVVDVWCGPDVTATARDTGVVTRQLFNEAEDRVLVVGFAIHQGREIVRTLASRLDADQSIEVTLCVDVNRAPGNTTLSSQIAGGSPPTLSEMSGREVACQGCSTTHAPSLSVGRLVAHCTLSAWS